jgi:hypothetical protein
MSFTHITVFFNKMMTSTNLAFKFWV